MLNTLQCILLVNISFSIFGQIKITSNWFAQFVLECKFLQWETRAAISTLCVQMRSSGEVDQARLFEVIKDVAMEIGFWWRSWSNESYNCVGSAKVISFNVSNDPMVPVAKGWRSFWWRIGIHHCQSVVSVRFSIRKNNSGLIFHANNSKLIAQINNDWWWECYLSNTIKGLINIFSQQLHQKLTPKTESGKSSITSFNSCFVKASNTDPQYTKLKEQKMPTKTNNLPIIYFQLINFRQRKLRLNE